MQALIAVGFGARDVIIKLACHWRIQLMHTRERRITRRHIGHDHPQRAHIQHLIETQALATHFFHNAVDVLRATLHRGAHALR